ncbi:MAG: hypothetical protein P8I51_02090 [Polaribacter sp.]|nr:hypothetical protein [Polaribacter sp.]MDG1953666.1 hypothetical protein [Polaribacter sp.]
MNLSGYVKRRNGVPLGHKDSLRNMLSRSLGAGRFSIFWNYWNPIWGFYLGIFIFKPLKLFLPQALSLIITFVVCGFIHDLAIMMLKLKFSLFLTPWFLFMGLSVVVSEYLKIDYSRFPWIVRSKINIIIILCCLFIANKVRL